MDDTLRLIYLKIMSFLESAEAGQRLNIFFKKPKGEKFLSEGKIKKNRFRSISQCFFFQKYLGCLEKRGELGGKK